MNLSDSEQFYYNLAAPVYQVAIPSLIALCFAGILANSLLLYTSKNVTDLHATLRLVYSLAASDIWSLAIVICSFVLNSYLPFVAGVEKFENEDCYMHALEALRLGSLFCSVFHLLSLAVCHYTVTAYPLNHREILTPLIKPLIGLLWLAPPFCFLLIFFCFYDQTFGEPQCIARVADSKVMRASLFVLVGVALTATSVIYLKLICRLRGMHSDLLSRRRVAFNRRLSRTICTALLIISTFLIGWLPGVAFFLITCRTCLLPLEYLYRKCPGVILGFGIGGNALMILKAVINPVIYASRLPEIQKSIRKSRQSRNSSRYEPVMRMSEIKRKFRSISKSSTEE